MAEFVKYLVKLHDEGNIDLLKQCLEQIDNFIELVPYIKKYSVDKIFPYVPREKIEVFDKQNRIFIYNARAWCSNMLKYISMDYLMTPDLSGNTCLEYLTAKNASIVYKYLLSVKEKKLADLQEKYSEEDGVITVNISDSTKKVIIVVNE